MDPPNVVLGRLPLSLRWGYPWPQRCREMLKDSCQLIARRRILSGVLGPVPGVGKSLYDIACSHTQEPDRVGVIA